MRVHILHSGSLRQKRSPETPSTIIPLRERRPDRRPPPELEESVPTPLEPEARDRPVIIDPMPPAAQFRVLWSVSQLVRYLLTWWRMKLTGRFDEQTHAELTRQLFERMSGIWIKVGQLLSLRSDVMSNAMTRELSSLQFQARGFPPEVALAVLEEELGRPVSAVFSHFAVTPFAAASIAQVHRATLLRNNRAVVVKIMRPDVARSFNRDLRVLEFVVRWTGRLGLFRRMRMAEGLSEMRAILMEETDYQYEAVNLKRMRRNLKKHGVYVPRVVTQLSHRRVLVIEEVPGVLMSHYIRLRREDPDRVERWSLINGIDARTLARRLSVTVLRQILEDNEFHGDLHPGNIMLLTDNRIALIDFGSVGRLGQQTWTLYRYSLAALAMRDYARAADLMLMLSPSIAMANNRRLRQDMTLALRDWEFAGQMSGGSYADRSMASMSNAVARVMSDHKVPLSWAIMRVGRSLSTLDASLQTLVPDANFMTLARAYYRDRQRRARTLEGRRQALHAVMAQVAGVAADVQLLIGTGIRDQALRLHGALDRITHVRIVFLTFVQRGLQLLTLVFLLAAITDEGLRPLDDANEHWVPGPVIQFLLRAVPDLHPLQWLLLLVVMWYIRRMLRAVRLAIARLG
jgi:ubiquinone biosynthesis protein